MTFESFVITVVVIATFAIMTIIVLINRFLIICHPNEIVILSGRKRVLPDGSIVGYRLIRGGRTIRIPLLEKIARMTLATIPLELGVHNAYSKGGIPLNMEAIANIKIDSNEPAFGNAVERFLGKPLQEIHKIAKDTLEGNLRGVLATLTPEEVNEDRLKFAESLIDEADHDLKQLGLHLDTLKIQNISDEAGYLNAVGRRKTAEVVAAARSAEAEKKAEAEEAEAASLQRAEVAKARAQQEIQSAQIDTDREVKVKRVTADQIVVEQNNKLRVRQAELEKIAIMKEEEAKVAGQKAHVLFEQEVEQERIILQQKRLAADVFEPARAKKEAVEMEAKGMAAMILETGQAKLHILQETIKTYQSAKGEGEKIFMLNQLPEIIKLIVETVNQVSIDKISVIDAGNGAGASQGVARVVSQLPTAVLSLVEQIETATGVNILSQFQKPKAAPAPGVNS
ncbi:flotillin [candidate division KSB1 bacterium]|nr:flotillin [candidate division KSB1 bacterium]